jgi:HAD superfamily hydrolase (TIGR01509 family)
MGAARIEGIIFDLDGTLLDTNEAHVDAWVKGFREHGFDVPAERVRPEVGKGGDKLLPAVLGEQVDKKRGDDIRESVSRAFHAIATSQRFIVFDGAEPLLRMLRRRGIRLALATSSKEEDLDLMMQSAGVDLRMHFDAVVTKSDVDASKPDPDVVECALEKLGLPPERCLMIGDTRYDVLSARRAGVATVGVLTARMAAPDTLRERLEEAGAIAICNDLASVTSKLDHLLGA